LKKIADLEIGRHLRNITLGAGWGFITFIALPRLPITEILGAEGLKGWVMVPLQLGITITDKHRRGKLLSRLKYYQERTMSEQAINSSWAKRYTEGRFAACNCWGCRRGKSAVRRRLMKTYLLAYCVRCRKKVSIKNPHQVVFANRREAIGGTCPICGAKVFKTGKFYGANLFKS